MFLENEEEYERAIRVLEKLYEVSDQISPDMEKLKQAIIDYEERHISDESNPLI